MANRFNFQKASIGLICCLALLAAFFPNIGVTLLVGGSLALLVTLIIPRYAEDEAPAVIRIFLLALVLRLAFGALLEIFDMRSFFGGDAATYDHGGLVLATIWSGKASTLSQFEIFQATRVTGPGWGMNYFVGAIYFVFGRNIMLPQTICEVIGAAISPAVFVCAKRLYDNSRVAKVAALLVAVLPAMVIWTGQLLKDGLIVFLLVLCMIAILRLQKHFSVGAIAVLILCLTGILSLRFYIFYMVAAAAAGSLLVGSSNTFIKIVPRFAALLVIGVAMTYFGVLRLATVDLGRASDLTAVQNSRMDLAKSANSGVDPETDVSTPEGALSTIPIGLVYLFLAPFPWSAANLRQAITIPEVLIWYAMLPLIVSGFIYTLRNRFTRALPILIFSTMLTIAYSIFQGNVGTAYRQRTQIQVFLFIFAAVGYELIQEKRRDRKMIEMRARSRYFADGIGGDPRRVA